LLAPQMVMGLTSHPAMGPTSHTAIGFAICAALLKRKLEI